MKGSVDHKGWFPMFVDLRERKILVVGAGRIGSRRIGTLADFAPDITVIAPEVSRQVEALEAAGAVKLLRREYREEDLAGMELVVAATGSEALNGRIAEACRGRGIPVNDISDRTRCDFCFPGIVRRGDLVIGVNAGGQDHRKVKEIRQQIETLLEELDESMEN